MIDQRLRPGVTALVAACALLAARPAAAQLSTAPFTGLATAHVGVAAGNDDRGSTLSLGGSVAMLEPGGWGAEFDFGYAADSDDGRDGGLDTQTYTLNVIGQWPTGRWRPFVVGGAGGLRARTCTPGCADARAWTDWALTGGGGLHVVMTPVFAVRADLRYFTALNDHPMSTGVGGLSFWRFAVGASFLWNEVP